MSRKLIGGCASQGWERAGSEFEALAFSLASAAKPLMIINPGNAASERKILHRLLRGQYEQPILSSMDILLTAANGHPDWLLLVVIDSVSTVNIAFLEAKGGTPFCRN